MSDDLDQDETAGINELESINKETCNVDDTHSDKNSISSEPLIIESVVLPKPRLVEVGINAAIDALCHIVYPTKTNEDELGTEDEGLGTSRKEISPDESVRKDMTFFDDPKTSDSVETKNKR